MASTENFNLELADNSDLVSQFVADYNANLGKIDALPVPVAVGSNSQMSYMRYADGTVMMWGHFDHGNRYKCTKRLTDVSYVSDPFRVTFPVSLASTDAVILAFATDSVAIECKAGTRNLSTTCVDVYYYCPTQEESTSQRTKTCDIVLFGKWK